MLRIGFLGGGCTGKSTAAARLFYELKQRGYNVELVSEYIKQWAWEKRMPASYDQLYIFAKQLRNEDLVLRTGTSIITDSPLHLQLAYVKEFHPQIFKELLSLCKKFDKQHPSLNILLPRVNPFQPLGRFATEEAAKLMDEKILKVLQDNNFCYSTFDPGKYWHDIVVTTIMELQCHEANNHNSAE